MVRNEIVVSETVRTVEIGKNGRKNSERLHVLTSDKKKLLQ